MRIYSTTSFFDIFQPTFVEINLARTLYVGSGGSCHGAARQHLNGWKIASVFFGQSFDDSLQPLRLSARHYVQCITDELRGGDQLLPSSAAAAARSDVDVR